MSERNGDGAGVSRRHRSISFPILLAALGVWVLYLSAGLPDFVQRGRQLPGPRFFPTLLGTFMLVAAVVELTFYVRQRRRDAIAREALKRDSGAQSARSTVPPRERWRAAVRDWGNRSVALILLALIAFVPVTRVLGFLLGGTLFSSVLMIRLRARWYNAIIVSLVVVFVVTLVFGRVFRVPLPAGVLGVAI